MTNRLGLKPDAAPRFIELLHLVDQNTPCVVDPAPFSSDDRAERAEAAEACQWCPALEACAAYADAQRETWHVWAGVDRTPKPRASKKEQAA
ncbi:WhiB family transcriptional regulator [Nocardioides panacisoli]|uniref:WhiB family transcriptional regulator n=1 Tax=Nocardioides panacisoli TaxID=627624 RepID=UPI001C626107|nr:WhiB family transcriptional regulator [Nocardioides panacisoli]QYJ05386.1 WhiB family transcriptional regulator [Nocardioides panacisoli]